MGKEMREFKVGDWVIFIHKSLSNWWKNITGISLYEKVGKIIDIKNYSKNSEYSTDYLIEFEELIKSGHARKGKDGYCIWSEDNEFISLDHLKLKKLLKEK